MFAVILQLAHRLADVVERKMSTLFAEGACNVGRPTFGEFLDRADVEIAIVEKSLERRHQARHEASILANAVAAHGRCATLHVLRQKLERRLLGLRKRHGARTHTGEQTRTPC